MSKKTYSKLDNRIIKKLGIKKAYFFEALRSRFEAYPKGFWKFTSPCRNLLYKAGESWCEELGMTRKVIWQLKKSLITHYKSKTAYKNSPDKFAGKMFCSYSDKTSYITYYFIDKTAVDKFLASLYQGGANV